MIEPAALSDSRLVTGVIAGFFVLGLRIVLLAVRGRDDIVLRAEDTGPTRYRWRCQGSRPTTRRDPGHLPLCASDRLPGSGLTVPAINLGRWNAGKRIMPDAWLWAMMWEDPDDADLLDLITNLGWRW